MLSRSMQGINTVLYWLVGCQPVRRCDRTLFPADRQQQLFTDGKSLNQVYVHYTEEQSIRNCQDTVVQVVSSRIQLGTSKHIKFYIAWSGTFRAK